MSKPQTRGELKRFQRARLAWEAARPEREAARLRREEIKRETEAVARKLVEARKELERTIAETPEPPPSVDEVYAQVQARRQAAEAAVEASSPPSKPLRISCAGASAEAGGLRVRQSRGRTGARCGKVELPADAFQTTEQAPSDLRRRRSRRRAATRPMPSKAPSKLPFGAPAPAPAAKPATFGSARGGRRPRSRPSASPRRRPSRRLELPGAAPTFGSASKLGAAPAFARRRAAGAAPTFARVEARHHAYVRREDPRKGGPPRETRGLLRKAQPREARHRRRDAQEVRRPRARALGAAQEEVRRPGAGSRRHRPALLFGAREGRREARQIDHTIVRRQGPKNGRELSDALHGRGRLLQATFAKTKRCYASTTFHRVISTSWPRAATLRGETARAASVGRAASLPMKRVRCATIGEVGEHGEQRTEHERVAVFHHAGGL